MREYGYRVRNRSTSDIALAAEDFLRRHAPDHLDGGGALDLVRLADHELQQAGVQVYPVHSDELPDAEAETRASDGRWIEILVREELYRALYEADANTNRARSTLAHEIGHAILHEPEVRAGRHLPAELALRRAPRNELKPYQDSEWQAHTFAGAVLIPRPALRKVNAKDEGALAALFGVSEAFVRSHLRRIRRAL